MPPANQLKTYLSPDTPISSVESLLVVESLIAASNAMLQVQKRRVATSMGSSIVRQGFSRRTFRLGSAQLIVLDFPKISGDMDWRKLSSSNSSNPTTSRCRSLKCWALRPISVGGCAFCGSPRRLVENVGKIEKWAIQDSNLCPPGCKGNSEEAQNTVSPWFYRAQISFTLVFTTRQQLSRIPRVFGCFRVRLG